MVRSIIRFIRAVSDLYRTLFLQVQYPFYEDSIEIENLYWTQLYLMYSALEKRMIF